MSTFNGARPSLQALCIEKMGRASFAKILTVTAILGVFLTGCGGGGGGSNPAAAPIPVATTASAPATSSKLGETTMWQTQLTDNSSNVINLASAGTVTTVNADGSYDITRAMVGGSMAVVNGTDYTVNDVESYDASGHAASIVYKQKTPNQHCSYSGSTTPVAFPLSSSLTWTKYWTKTCTDGTASSIAITNGHYIAQETLTIPAGSFSANHAAFTRTETISGATPLVITSNYDCWYEVTSNRELKCQWTNVRGGGFASTNGYPVSGIEQVQSSSYDIAYRTPPTAGNESVFKRTVVDNSSNTISFHFTSGIAAVNADGSYTSSVTTDGGSQELLDGTNYELDSTSSVSVNGTVVSTTYPLTSNTCRYSADNSQTLVHPLAVGMTWSKNWTESCTNGFNGSLALTNAQVVDVEAITVPAGTFSTFKVQYTITRTPVGTNPIVATTVSTCWIDTVTGKSLKCTYLSGSNGYATSITDELQTFH